MWLCKLAAALPSSPLLFLSHVDSLRKSRSLLLNAGSEEAKTGASIGLSIGTYILRHILT